MLLYPQPRFTCPTPRWPWGAWGRAFEQWMRALCAGRWQAARGWQRLGGKSWGHGLLAVCVGVSRPRSVPWTTATRLRAAQWLLEQGADPMRVSVWPGLSLPLSPWHSPILAHPDWVRLFLAHGASVNHRDPVSGLSVLESWWRWSVGGNGSVGGSVGWARALEALDVLMAAGLNLNGPFRDPTRLALSNWTMPSDEPPAFLSHLAFACSPTRLLALLERGLSGWPQDADGPVLMALLRAHLTGADLHQEPNPDGARHVLAHFSAKALTDALQEAPVHPAIGPRRARL